MEQAGAFNLILILLNKKSRIWGILMLLMIPIMVIGAAIISVNFAKTDKYDLVMGLWLFIGTGIIIFFALKGTIKKDVKVSKIQKYKGWNLPKERSIPLILMIIIPIIIFNFSFYDSYTKGNISKEFAIILRLFITLFFLSMIGAVVWGYNNKLNLEYEQKLKEKEILDDRRTMD